MATLSLDKMSGDNMSKRWLVAIATTAEVEVPPEIFAAWSGETHLTEELKQQGCDIKHVNWYDPDVIWGKFDLVLANRVWDYPQKVDQFLNWLKHLEKLGVKTINSTEILRWNTNKSYLIELLQSGAPMIDTVFLSSLSEIQQLPQILRDKGWREVIIKPAVGNRNIRILKTSQADDEAKRHAEQLVQENGGAVVQPFLPSIETEGEWSLVFFNGDFSHAVRALPHGELGRMECKTEDLVIVQPPEEVLGAANEVIHRLPWRQPPGFARVDLLRGQGDEGYKLVEIEMIEPVLYMGLFNQAAKPFAHAVMAALK